MKPKIIAPSPEIIEKTLSIIQKESINTVCFSSKCPNISECFKRGTATFMIMGNICTRNCKFCGVASGNPLKLDKSEPEKIANAVKELNLNYVVITSVDRDDLEDFGSSHFCEVIEKVKITNPDTKIEALTPDFQGDIKSIEKIVNSPAYKLAHNIETVEKLHKRLKPKSEYKLSLQVLEFYSKYKITKSSLIVGFGESLREIEKTFKDLRDAGVSQLTIGQYLQPTPKHYPVEKYYTEEEFEELKNLALSYGFKAVVSGNLIRSSYYADKL